MTYLTQRIQNLQEAVIHFSDPLQSIAFAVQQRWPSGVITCPTCGLEGSTWIPSRRLFQCKNKHAKRQFSVKVGTVMEDSPIPLGQWLIIGWMLTTCRNGISSYEVARTIGITQKSAWFMLHRLRDGMKMEHLQLSGTVEADETYYGGKIKNKHVNARKQGKYKDKTPIFGMVERGGMAVAGVVEEAKAATVVPMIEASVAKEGTIVHTDNFPIYDKLQSKGFTHEVIDHTKDRFVRGTVNTNSIENLWACIKRMLEGTYISVRPKHLNSYVAEQVFRYNHRFKFVTEEMRLRNVLDGVLGRRLTYKQLIAR